MSKIFKGIRLNAEQVDNVQLIADRDHGGNFTSAVASLVNQAISMRYIDEGTRESMYVQLKESYDNFGASLDRHQTRNILDALHL